MSLLPLAVLQVKDEKPIMAPVLHPEARRTRAEGVLGGGVGSPEAAWTIIATLPRFPAGAPSKLLVI